MNAMCDVAEISLVGINLDGGRLKTPIGRHSDARRKPAKAGAIASAVQTGGHPILAKLRDTQILDHERQFIILRQYRRACRDVDWLLAVSATMTDEIRSVLGRFDDPSFRLSDFFHMDKKPGKEKRDSNASRRRDALKAKYVALCEAYLDAHADEVAHGLHSSTWPETQALADRFRALGVNSELRDAVISRILDKGTAPDARPDERSHAIMLRQALSEAERARSIIETTNQRLVLSIARKLRVMAPDMEFGDLLSEGQFGLRRAVEKFEPDLGHKFTTYAVWWIRQSILRAIKDRSSLIRIPAHIQERARKADSAATARPLTEIVSLHEPLAGAPDRTLCDVLPGDEGTGTEQSLIRKQMREVLAKAITTLTDRERFVILHRFGLRSREMDIGAIAARLDLSKQRIRQIERDALRKLAAHRGVSELRP